MSEGLNTNSIQSLYQSLKHITNDANVELFEDRITKLDFRINNKPENSNDTIKERFLKPSNVLPWSLLDMVQEVPEMNFLDDHSDKLDYKELLKIPGPINRTSYQFKRIGLEGKIAGHKEEVNLKEIANANASNSLSITRSINHNQNSVRGSTAQLPFTPGGIPMKSVKPDLNQNGTSTMANATKLLHKDAQGLFDIPEGMKRGIEPVNTVTENDDENGELKELKKLNEIDNELEIKKEIDEAKIAEETSNKTLSEAIMEEAAEEPVANNADDAEIDELLPIGIDFGRTKAISKNVTMKKEWAHVVDLNHKIENFDELIPNPARTWPFELDTFQKEAVYHLEQGDSVFVAAHTSAGKTVVAEYAIAMAHRNMTKTIYTSPIKALSNQKFRDFKETFGDVDIGLITGDVQINSDANCLIMTTEILRSMLYRGADLIRDVEFVIFDEVHYVNDQDRGVVWEEVIIMLPQHVKFILLSATVPNTYEFANWIGRTKQKNIYVISTPKRPVPLEINIWAKKELIPVINPNSEFLDANFRKHKEILNGDSTKGGPSKSDSGRGGSSARGGRGGTNTRGGRGGRGNSARGGANRGGSRGAGAIGSNKRKFFTQDGPSKKTWPDIINYLRKKELLPMVVFVFSKKRCEEYADWLEGINFCNNKEKSQIHMFIEKSITRLKKEDRDLPQILKIRSLLERGIAVHHGGLLPIVKELIEILFSKGFIKVLFATETFAMGLNLPTRTVIFSSIRKHDGNGLRELTPGEFTQMAGRAGRRGLDSTGTVIVMAYNSPLSIGTFKEVTMGVPTRLQSQFRLTYNMILNLLRIEALRVEEMIKYSFSENAKETLQPEHEKQIKLLQEELQTIEYKNCEICDNDIGKFLELMLSYKDATVNMMQEMVKSPSVLHILKEGRLVAFRDTNNCLKLGFVFKVSLKDAICVIMTFTKPYTLPNGESNNLLYFPNSGYRNRNFPKFERTDFYMEEVPVSAIEVITKRKFNTPLGKVMKKDSTALSEFESETNSIFEGKTLKETINIEKQGLKIHQILLDRTNIKDEIFKLKSTKCPNLSEHIVPRYKAHVIEDKIKELYHLMSDQNLSLLPNYEKRLAVLNDTGFIDENHNVLLKGRVACEINSGYELVLTELILDNFLGNFEPEEIVALLSVFVYEGKTREEESPIVTPRLAKGKQRIEEIYKKMLEVFSTHQIPLTQDEAEFLDRKRFAMMNVVYEWARGLSFKEIMEMSPEAEGTVVRVITWLDEICREVKTASIIIGNSTLHMKMSRAQELIKRDIVFAASLYL
ncbi:ski2p [Saccharomyces arboricola H-6]|uniref:RNA helicase n=1 Tax=Saccharomyces arboricola (strain H-6 / AS 2.3317 / CBS 10644) TaxID=1160507 RepID=J8Q4X0_SACAR|nr:ski2p [Saccharomyces arboricola H-6]